MTLTVSSNYDNPQVPGVSAFTYYPDQLIAGPQQLVTQNVTLAAGTLSRGAVLGQQNTFSYVTAAKTGGNTGNGTVGTVTPGNAPEVGVYTLTATAPTTFSVTDPEGTVIGTATTGSAFTSAEVNFTITAGGTAFVAGDAFTITTTGGLGNFILSVKTASDGSQTPSAILADNSDASGGPVRVGVYVTGEFNDRAVNFDSSWTRAGLATALRAFNIHLKSSVSAADPS